MNKTRKIILSVLGIFIVLIVIMLSITPMMKNNIKEQQIAIEQQEKEKHDAVSLSDNVADIDLGVNPLVNGTGVLVSGADVYIKESGTYNISGKLTNGSIHVNTKGIVVLNLNNLELKTNKEAISIDSAYEVTINLVDGSKNYISDGANNPYIGAINANCPLKVEGTGSLFIEANEASFNGSDGYSLNGGLILALGNSELVRPNNDSLQPSAVLTFNNRFSNGNILIKDDNRDYIEYKNEKSWNNIIISGLPSGNNYYLYQDFSINEDGSYNGLIKINDNDFFSIN